AGDRAGQSSDLAVGRTKPSDNVDTWIGGPFHSVCLLSAWHSVSGFAIESGWAGEWCQSQLQAFDVSTGQHLPKVSKVNRAYTFPSSRMKVPTNLLVNFNENPDPVAGCTAHSAGTPWSVPVIFRVPNPPAGDKHLKHVTAKLFLGSHRIRPTCTITGSTYKGDYPGPQILGDSVSGQWVVLLPRVELKRGKTYHAVLT